MNFRDKFYALQAAYSTADSTRNLVNSMAQFVFNEILGTRWIVSQSGELGIRVCGVKFWYYKWPDPMVHVFSTSDYKYRVANKREFGEVVKSKPTYSTYSNGDKY